MPRPGVWRRACSTAAAFVLASTPLLAQDDPTQVPPLIDTLQVQIVNVEVTVTDRQGVPVAGLTRDDFEIYEDGQPQAITNFFAIQRTRVRSATDQVWVPIEDDSPFRRRMVLLVDNNTLSKPERNRALEAFHEFLDLKYDGTYEWSVIAVGEEVRVLQPLTSEKHLVRAALDRVRLMPTYHTRYRIEREALNDPVRVRMSQRSGRSIFDQEGSNNPGRDLTAALRFESRGNMFRNLEATLRTAAAMDQAFRAYGNLEGKKILVLLTGGIQMLPEYGFQSDSGAAQAGPGRGLPDPTVDDPELHQLYLQLREVLGEAVRSANAANFNVYPIKAGGLSVEAPQLDAGYRSSGTTFSPEAFSGPVELDDSDSGQLLLAEGTGGLALNLNRVLESFERVDSDTSAFYSLGYAPGHYGDGEYHRIRVATKTPGLRVRARSGYVDLTEEQRLERYLSSPLTFAKHKGSLPVALEIESEESGQVHATASLPISRIRFFEREGEHLARVYVYLTIYSEAGEFLELVRRHQDIRFPAALEDEAMERDFRYQLRFRLQPRHNYTVTVTLRDEISSEIGTAVGQVRL